MKLTSTHLSAFITLICLTVFAGCAPLPQPFRGTPSIASKNPLLDIPTAVGITVLPIKGLPEPLNKNLGTAVAEQLRGLEIPAEAAPYNAGLGFSLEGWAQILEPSPLGISIDITWTLRSLTGTKVGTYHQKAMISESAWRQGDSLEEATLGEEIANATTAMIGSNDRPINTVQPRIETAPDYPTVSVLPVEGAPGDGRKSLQLAVLQSLSLNGVPRDDINPEVIIKCEIISKPFSKRLQHVQILWRIQLADGPELGTAQLDNTIPIGALDGEWGATAFTIADAGAADILNLLASAARLSEASNP
ncbi:MAG TPA: hypothetical protein DGZ24_06915 [Rhodospirillaceae bacterium]|nr:hypothetical protein [Candidatus Neomarinimicrobiota bacterium]HCX15031.1 hypothetical protein [Rhodospirillaceae bacterium]